MPNECPMSRPRSGSAQAGLTRARMLKTRAQARLAQLAVEEREGRLVPVDAALAVEAARATALRASILTIPSRWALQVIGLPTPAAAQGVLERMANEVLENLSQTGAAIRDRLTARQRARGTAHRKRRP